MPRVVAVTALIFLLSLVAQAGVSFGPPVSYAAGMRPYAAAVADLNNDGKLTFW